MQKCLETSLLLPSAKNTRLTLTSNDLLERVESYLSDHSLQGLCCTYVIGKYMYESNLWWTVRISKYCIYFIPHNYAILQVMPHTIPKRIPPFALTMFDYQFCSCYWIIVILSSIKYFDENKDYWGLTVKLKRNSFWLINGSELFCNGLPGIRSTRLKLKLTSQSSVRGTNWIFLRHKERGRLSPVQSSIVFVFVYQQCQTRDSS